MNAPTTFFPSSRELHGGIEWLREHRMLATATAAAATAFSLYTYFCPENENIALPNWLSDEDLSAHNKDNDINRNSPCSSTGNDSATEENSAEIATCVCSVLSPKTQSSATFQRRIRPATSSTPPPKSSPSRSQVCNHLKKILNFLTIMHL